MYAPYTLLSKTHFPTYLLVFPHLFAVYDGEHQQQRRAFGNIARRVADYAVQSLFAWRVRPCPLILF